MLVLYGIVRVLYQLCTNQIYLLLYKKTDDGKYITDQRSSISAFEGEIDYLYSKKTHTNS
jgi:hypothetical protein